MSRLPSEDGDYSGQVCAEDQPPASMAVRRTKSARTLEHGIWPDLLATWWFSAKDDANLHSSAATL